jgi:hypothetical protein
MTEVQELLATRAETLRTRLAHARGQEADAAARATIEAGTRRARITRETLTAVAEAIPGLRALGVSTPTVRKADRDDLAKARTNLRRAASDVVGSEPPEVARRIGSATVNAALESSERASRYLATGLGKAAEARRRELLPDQIGDPIVAIPGAKDSLVARLRRIQARLTTPIDGLAVPELEPRLRAVQMDALTWTDERPLLDKPLEVMHPDVRLFLKEASGDNGAPWSRVSPAVREWLDNPEQSASIRGHLS